MTDFALFRLPDGTAWLGEGPFEALAQPPESGACFYWNDFDLSDARPWKRPSTVRSLKPGELPDEASGELPRVSWSHPETEYIKMVFRRIRRDIQAGRLEKLVPVLTEKGILLEGEWTGMLSRVLTAPDGFWGYARVEGDSGFAGATPELLFDSNASNVTTMALAGTAKPGLDEAFLDDVKEIEEHEIVSRYLAERLATVGEVERQPRRPHSAGGLTHFRTEFSATLSQPVDPAALVELLHPTPAVGCLPREERWEERLREYRSLLHVPPFFGAPFGFVDEGQCHMVVAIRGMAWEGKRAYLPSGCGIVGGSAFDHEWRELQLKRQAVMNLLGINATLPLAPAAFGA